VRLLRAVFHEPARELAMGRRKKKDLNDAFKVCAPGEFYGSRRLATVFKVLEKAENNIFTSTLPLYWVEDLATGERVRRTVPYLDKKLNSEMSVIAFMSRREGRRDIGAGMYCFCGGYKLVYDCCGTRPE